MVIHIRQTLAYTLSEIFGPVSQHAIYLLPTKQKPYYDLEIPDEVLESSFSTNTYI
jgi:hypothetical protein